MLIALGQPAIDRSVAFTNDGFTWLNSAQVANAAGYLTTVEIWFSVGPAADVKVGTFYGSGTSWTNRAFASLGSVNAGSKQTFSGLSIAVQADDLVGVYWSSGGDIEADSSGAGVKIYIGDGFDGAAHTYDLATGAGYQLSLYAFGATAQGRSMSFTPFNIY